MGSQKDSSIAANTIKDSEGTINIAIARPVAKGTRINSLPTPELEKAPPEGVEVGGIWGTIEYFGPMSIFWYALSVLLFASEYSPVTAIVIEAATKTKNQATLLTVLYM